MTGENSVFLHKMVKLFYVDLELNVPTFFSMLLLLAAAFLLAVIYLLARQREDVQQMKWAVLSVGFFYMAFDEILAIHDRLVEPMQALLGGEESRHFILRMGCSRHDYCHLSGVLLSAVFTESAVKNEIFFFVSCDDFSWRIPWF